MSPAERTTAEQILTAAATLFAERGYKATTTRAIAERANVNEVTIFRYFKNKQGLLAGLGAMWANQMAGFAVESLPDPSDTRATIETLARIEVAQAGQFGATALRLALDAPSNPEVAAVLGDGLERNLGGLAEYLAERQAAGDLRADVDARVMAEGFFALTSTLVMSRQLLGSGEDLPTMPVENVVQQLVEVYLTGIWNSGRQ